MEGKFVDNCVTILLELGSLISKQLEQQKTTSVDKWDQIITVFLTNSC